MNCVLRGCFREASRGGARLAASLNIADPSLRPLAVLAGSHLFRRCPRTHKRTQRLLLAASLPRSCSPPALLTLLLVHSNRRASTGAPLNRARFAPRPHSPQPSAMAASGSPAYARALVQVCEVPAGRPCIVHTHGDGQQACSTMPHSLLKFSKARVHAGLLSTHRTRPSWQALVRCLP